MTERPSMQDLFESWVDTDVALYYLAGLLGVKNLDPSHEAWVKAKWVFNTGNPISDSMFVVFQELVKLEVLEETDVGFVRWNSQRNAIA